MANTATQSKDEQILDNMNAPPVIDENVKINIPRSPVQFDPKKHKFICSCCGKPFSIQKGNFQKTNDVLFQANGGYLPWCKDCTDAYLNQVNALYSNNEELAIRDFCQRAGWNYDLAALVSSRETYSGHRDRSRISHYAAKKNINCDGRKTYIDSIKYEYQQRQNNVILSKDDIKSDNVTVKGVAIDRWGTGLTEWDYQILEDHYKMLKKNNPNADNNAEIFIKSLCNLNWLQAKMLRSDTIDANKYATLVEQYSKTFKQAGLRTVEEKDASNDETFCMTLGFFSEYTPEEFYKDKELYKDHDRLGEYIERHITRPMINLETGSNIRDTEFFVPEGDDYDEE